MIDGLLQEYQDILMFAAGQDADHGFLHRQRRALQALHEVAFAVEKDAGNSVFEIERPGFNEQGFEIVVSQIPGSRTHVHDCLKSRHELLPQWADGLLFWPPPLTGAI